MQKKTRIWRVQGDLRTDGSARIEAFFCTEVLDNGAVVGSAPAGECALSLDQKAEARTVVVNGKTLTYKEVFDGVTAIMAAEKTAADARAVAEAKQAAGS